MIATINRKTRKGEPETGTDGSSQTRQNPRVDGYGYGFGPPRSSGSGFWTGLEPNRTVFPVQTRTAGGLPGPVANTTPAELGTERGKLVFWLLTVEGALVFYLCSVSWRSKVIWEVGACIFRAPECFMFR